MLNDAERNGAIERSIADLDLTGKLVFEIGTGTGLIAMLFAKYGAKHIITCEMNQNLAEVARTIVAKSAFADKITILNLPSNEVIDSRKLPFVPDVIFTETLDCGVVGEGFFSIAADIARISGPQTIVMPTWINQFCVPIESHAIKGLNHVQNACGFDLSPINDYSTFNYFPLHAGLFPHRHMSEHVLIRNYTYSSISMPVPHVIDIESDGAVHGLLSWFKADFGAGIVSNKSGVSSHWHQAFHPLAEELAVRRGDRLSVLIDDSGHANASRLPR